MTTPTSTSTPKSTAKPSTPREGVSYELGSATMLDGLDEALEGLSAGEETSFEGTLEAGKHEGERP